MKSAYPTALLAALALAGCDSMATQRQAMGDVTSLIVVAADSLWSRVGDDVLAALEPRIFAVRDESTFELTQVSPASPDWRQLQRFRQIVAIGTATDPWMETALDGAQPATVPDIVERGDVWARSQSVTVVVLPQTGEDDALRSQLNRLGSLLDQRFRSYAKARMFASDSNVALRDSLASTAGFAITLPNIYHILKSADTVYAFHNRNEVGGDLFRSIVVAWRTGVHAGLDRDAVLAWRDEIAPIVFDMPQRTVTDRIESTPLEGAAAGSLQVQGAWAATDPSYPMGGPFLDRVVVCPDQNRTYFLEAWMYGPSRRKYEYMLQFENILGSFHCGVAAR
jgi:Domain of unknown function (DUF4837)